jgi:hypothetical protein
MVDGCGVRGMRYISGMVMGANVRERHEILRVTKISSTELVFLQYLLLTNSARLTCVDVRFFLFCFIVVWCGILFMFVAPDQAQRALSRMRVGMSVEMTARRNIIAIHLRRDGWVSE